MLHLKPENDGVDHINIYSKGLTELGRMLTNFYRYRIDIPEAGSFYSLEGFWYWLFCNNIIAYHQSQGLYFTLDKEILSGIDGLRYQSGFHAKAAGRDLVKRLPESPWTEPTEEFKAAFVEALKIKIHTIPGLGQAFIESYPKPLLHYYVYGRDSARPNIKVPASGEWLCKVLTDYREELVNKRP